jgi:hypothetical protein
MVTDNHGGSETYPVPPAMLGQHVRFLECPSVVCHHEPDGRLTSARFSNMKLELVATPHVKFQIRPFELKVDQGVHFPPLMIDVTDGQRTASIPFICPRPASLPRLCATVVCPETVTTVDNMFAPVASAAERAHTAAIDAKQETRPPVRTLSLLETPVRAPQSPVPPGAPKKKNVVFADDSHKPACARKLLQVDPSAARFLETAKRVGGLAFRPSSSVELRTRRETSPGVTRRRRLIMEPPKQEQGVLLRADVNHGVVHRHKVLTGLRNLRI